MPPAVPTAVPPTFSWVALASLLAALGASAACFAWLTRRWTTDRPRAALADWARGRRFRLDRPPAAGGPVPLPAGLSALLAADPRVDVGLVRGPVAIVRVTTGPRAGTGGRRPAWHLLVRTTAGPGQPTPAGLRPVVAAEGASVVDLLPPLGGYPSLLPPERFVVFAADGPAARRLAASPARGLLPHDVGLLVHGPAVVLDFSGRPFDGVEFDRMLVVAEQLVQHFQGA